MSYPDVSYVECPRDAIQGIQPFIPTEKKVVYINKLIASNLFEYIDFGSFVSPKAVPQMQDTLAVLDGLEKINSTKLLTIIANQKGAEIGSKCEKVDYLGYPFSISNTFQVRNTNSTIEESFERIKSIQDITLTSNKELIVYISMAFGNPYNDPYLQEIVMEWVDKLSKLGIKRFSIADTTSEAQVSDVTSLFQKLFSNFSHLIFSAHLHSRKDSSLLKINAAYEAGCRRFEGAFMGFGGCPFAKDELVGNIPMELLLERFEKTNSAEISKLIMDFQNMLNINEL